MMTRIKTIQKNVRYGRKQFKLTYYLLLKDSFYYAIRVDCWDQNNVETNQIWVGTNRSKALQTFYLFAKETVFPVALQETWENL